MSIKATYNPKTYKYAPNNIIKANSQINQREAYRKFSDTPTYQSPINLGVVRRTSPRVNADSAASAGVGILGAASIASPALVPFAAAAGIGYGVYKLGESFSLW